jgi:hypothetical protein
LNMWTKYQIRRGCAYLRHHRGEIAADVGQSGPFA